MASPPESEYETLSGFCAQICDTSTSETEGAANAETDATIEAKVKNVFISYPFPLYRTVTLPPYGTHLKVEEPSAVNGAPADDTRGVASGTLSDKEPSMTISSFTRV